MKICALLLLLFSSVAQAGWVLYGDNGKAEFYYDDQSIVSSGATVSVLEMLSYSFPLNGVLSNRSRKEYNCVSQEFRNLKVSFIPSPTCRGERSAAIVIPKIVGVPLLRVLATSS